MAADSKNEPVWFVQLTAAGEEPKQEGPITLEDLIKRIKKKQLIGDDYVWSPGMESWGQIQDIEILRVNLPEPTRITDPENPKKFSGKLPSLSEFSVDSTRFAERKKDETATPVGVELETLSDMVKATLGAASVRAAKATPLEELALPIASNKASASFGAAPVTGTVGGPRRKKGDNSDLQKMSLLKAAGLSVLIGISFYVIFGQFSPTSLISEGLWAKLFVHFPSIGDVAEDDYTSLKDAASKLLIVSGPHIAIAPSRTSGEAISLYLATNLSLGSKFDIYLQGDQDTLTGDSVAIAPVKITTSGVLTRLPPITAPMGYYWVHVFAGDNQPKRTNQLLPSMPSAAPLISSKSFPTNQKLLISKKLFMGGVPDLNYQSRLKDYFSNRRGKALAELDSIRDIVLMIEDRLVAENKAARGLINLPNQAARSQAWNIYESSWNSDAANLDRFSHTNFHFYSQTQSMGRNIIQTLLQLHTLHSWLTKARPDEDMRRNGSSKLNTSSVEVASIIVNGETTSNAIRTRIAELKARLDRLTKDAENPNAQIQEEAAPELPPVQ